MNEGKDWHLELKGGGKMREKIGPASLKLKWLIIILNARGRGIDNQEKQTKQIAS